MMFTGTTQQQDTRFSDKEKKLMKQMKFGDCLNKRVDMSKVKLDVLRPWISKKITDILHIEDDVVVEFVYNQLEEEKYPCPKKMQINMTGFLNGRNARHFMGELWSLLLSAQDSGSGIPTEFIQNKKEEILKREAHPVLHLSDLVHESSAGKNVETEINNSEHRKNVVQYKSEKDSGDSTNNENYKGKDSLGKEFKKDKKETNTNKPFLLPTLTEKDTLKSPKNKTSSEAAVAKTRPRSPKRSNSELSENFEPNFREHNVFSDRKHSKKKHSRNSSRSPSRRFKTHFHRRTQSKSPAKRSNISQSEIGSGSQSSIAQSSFSGQNGEEHKEKVSSTPKEGSTSEKPHISGQSSAQQYSSNLERKGANKSEEPLRNVEGRKSPQTRLSSVAYERSKRNTKQRSRCHNSSLSNSPECNNESFEIRKNTNSIQLKRHYRNNRYSSTSSVEADAAKFGTESKRRENDGSRQFDERRTSQREYSKTHHWPSTAMRRRSRSVQLYSRSPNRRSRSPRRFHRHYSPIVNRRRVINKRGRYNNPWRRSNSRGSNAIERNRSDRRSSPQRQYVEDHDSDHRVSPVRRARPVRSPTNTSPIQYRTNNRRESSTEKKKSQNFPSISADTNETHEVDFQYEQCGSKQEDTETCCKHSTIEEKKICQCFQKNPIKASSKSELSTKQNNESQTTSMPLKKPTQRNNRDDLSTENVKGSHRNSKVEQVGFKDGDLSEMSNKQNFSLGETRISKTENKIILSRTPSPFLKQHELETNNNVPSVSNFVNSNWVSRNDENERSNQNLIDKNALLKNSEPIQSKKLDSVSANKKAKYIDDSNKNEAEQSKKYKPPLNVSDTVTATSENDILPQDIVMDELFPKIDNYSQKEPLILTENPEKSFDRKKKKSSKRKFATKTGSSSESESYNKKKKYKKQKKHEKKNKKEKKGKKKLKKTKTHSSNQNSDSGGQYEYLSRNLQTMEQTMLFDGINDDLEKKLRERALKSMKKID